jgi:hypothetical protein
MSLHVIPVGGLVIAAAFKALNTARYLHKPVVSFGICCHIFIEPFL